MSESLLSAGIDVGTSTTQLVFSRLSVANQASGFSVPRIVITDKEVVYRSAIHLRRWSVRRSWMGRSSERSSSRNTSMPASRPQRWIREQ